MRPERLTHADTIIVRIARWRDRYEEVERAIRVPWFIVAVIHSLESSLDFTTHLHNGDPLTRRTIHVPVGRPLTREPPFTWLQSAVDALTLKRLETWTDWSAAGSLYQLEGYNGFGYRRVSPAVPTPYLWSFSQHYERGKFTADGRYDPITVSVQCGAAVLLARMAALGTIPPLA